VSRPAAEQYRQPPKPLDVGQQPQSSASRQALSDALGNISDRARIALSGSRPVEREPVVLPSGKHVNVQMRHCLVRRFTIRLDQA
jgi:hypothetical protein